MSPPTNNWRSRQTRQSLICGNSNGYHNTELRKSRHMIGEHKKLKT